MDTVTPWSIALVDEKRRQWRSRKASQFRFHRWRANLRMLDVNEIKTIPRTPRSHAFVERLIGTIRRE